MSSEQRSQRWHISHCTEKPFMEMCYFHLFFLLYALANHLYWGRHRGIECSERCWQDFIYLFLLNFYCISFMHVGIHMAMYVFLGKKQKHGCPPLNLTLNPNTKPKYCFFNYCYMNNIFILFNKYNYIFMIISLGQFQHDFTKNYH